MTLRSSSSAAECSRQVAVRYSSDVHSIKRANNLISDHSLASRQRVFVPGTPPVHITHTRSFIPLYYVFRRPAAMRWSRAGFEPSRGPGHAVAKAEDRIGRAVTIKWCPIVCREYAVLGASADATCFTDFGSKTKPHDDAALAKLSSLLSRGKEHIGRRSFR